MEGRLKLWDRLFGRRAPEHTGVQIEGHGRAVRLAPYSFAAVLEPQRRLLVSSSASGDVASAYISTEGPPERAARRPAGPIEEAGIVSVTHGPAGAWHVRVRQVRFPWPEGALVRVPPDDHPGDMMPLYLARSVDSDEMVTLFGVFDVAPDPMEFVAPGQEVLRSESEDGGHVLELRYAHREQQWRQWFHWAPLATGVVVVRAQELEGSSAGLAAIAKRVRSSLVG